MFDGEAAREIGMLARERWARACNRKLAIRAHRVRLTQDAWPPSRSVDLENADIAISLTEPAYMGRKATANPHAVSQCDRTCAPQHSLSRTGT